MGGGGRGGFLRENDMLQDAVFIHNLLNDMSRRNLHREGDGGLMVDADHPNCGGALNHLHLFPQLQADGFSLVDMEVDNVLPGVGCHPVACRAWVAHGHGDPGALARLAAAAGRGDDHGVGVAVVLVATRHAGHVHGGGRVVGCTPGALPPHVGGGEGARVGASYSLLGITVEGY